MKIDRDKLHLLHIRDAAGKILEYSSSLSFDEFVKNSTFYDAILMQIIVLGEAVNTLSAEFKEIHHDLPWYEAVGLRNQIAHGYIETKPDIVWDTVVNDIPKLKKQIDLILDNY
ncbi:MAG: DUF86 domain-containing protein [Candidatus Berkelbacteria bacterium]|nr:DUF86 domain-containing protein [Candidatus Berkelbacteria bacterium]